MLSPLQQSLITQSLISEFFVYVPLIEEFYFFHFEKVSDVLSNYIIVKVYQ